MEAWHIWFIVIFSIFFLKVLILAVYFFYLRHKRLEKERARRRQCVVTVQENHHPATTAQQQAVFTATISNSHAYSNPRKVFGAVLSLTKYIFPIFYLKKNFLQFCSITMTAICSLNYSHQVLNVSVSKKIASLFECWKPTVYEQEGIMFRAWFR